MTPTAFFLLTLFSKLLVAASILCAFAIVAFAVWWFMYCLDANSKTQLVNRPRYGWRTLLIVISAGIFFDTAYRTLHEYFPLKDTEDDEQGE